jgi:hypothetical protein
LCVVCAKVEESADSRAKGKALLLLLNESNMGCGYGAVILAEEGVIRRKGSISLREFGIRSKYWRVFKT